MSGSSVTESGPNLDVWFVGFKKKLNKNIDELVEQIADEGQKLVYGFIETRGTGRVWARAYNGRDASAPGRDATGNMKNSVEQRSSSGSTAAVASFGWLDHYEEYFGLQEGGFTQDHTGIKIEAMNAIHDAGDIMFQRAQQLLKVKLSAL